MILIVGIFGANFSMAQNDRQPNIVLINVDDISAKEFAAYGGNMKLPAVEQLAKEGVQFKTAWASPECVPSRAVLLTGTYPHNNGNYQNQIRPDTSFLENPKHTLLFPTMKAAGYSCGMFGKMHHERNRDPKIYQADDYCLWKMWDGHDGPNHRYWHPSLVANGEGIKTTKEDFGPEIVFNYLLDFIDKSVANDKPFFAYCPAILAHQEKKVNENKWFFPDMPKIDKNGDRVAGTVKGTLYTMMKFQDHLVGRLIDHLESTGILENTVVIFTADNGTPGYGKGLYPSELGLRVPFIVAHGGVKKHGESDVMIDFTDILPTLLELAGYEGQIKTDGQSFAGYLYDQPNWKQKEYLKMTFMNARWVRNRDWMIDGLGHFWDCRNTADESAFIDATYSDDPFIVAQRRKLQAVLETLPALDEQDPKWNKTTKKLAEVYTSNDH
ncbi:MAG: sulfatase-like hydrolase/transferase [Cyclobacteriaceae bacterium]